MLSCVAEGTALAFLREFISLYMVGIVCYLATIVYCNKYGEFHKPLVVLYGCGILNTIVNGLQYIGHPIGLALGVLFVNENNEQKSAMFEHLSNGESGSFLFGLYGDPVLNGYYSLFVPILALYFLMKSQDKTADIFHLTIGLISYVILFLIQQRAAFIFASAILVYMIIKRYGFKKKYALFFLSCLILLLVAIPLIVSSPEFSESRLMSQDEDSRSLIYSKAIMYILEKPIFGGIQGFVEYANNMPHNVIFNAFIYSGIIGGLCILRILYKQIIITRRCIKSDYSSAIAFLFLGYTLTGLLHNPSIVTGDAILWILWGGVYWTYYKYAKQ
jgi:hypothetical protein